MNNKDRLPYLKAVIVLLVTVWGVAVLTAGLVLDEAKWLLEKYSDAVSPLGWYTFGAAVIVTVVVLTTILVREVRK